MKRRRTSPTGCEETFVPIGRDIYAAVIKVTPELALSWLPKDELVWRALNRRKVGAYTTHMLRGRWVVDGNSIKFNSDGKLLDGQHRLQACIQAEKPFKTVAIIGAIAQHSAADTGLPRSLNDLLRHRGYSNCSALGAILRMHYGWIETEGNFTEYYNRGLKLNLQHEDLLTLLKLHPDIQASAAYGKEVGRRLHGIFPLNCLGHLHYLFLLDSAKEDVEEFFSALQDISALGMDDPRSILRRHLEIRREESRRAGATTWDIVTIHAIVIKAWNLWCRGAPCKSLRWNRHGNPPEKFPIILTR